MADRYNYLTVGIESNIHEDECKALIAAIRQLRGVLAVEPHVLEASDWLAEERAKQELGQKIWHIIYPR